MFLVLTLFLIAPIKESYSISQGVTPAVDDAWFVILENLKVNSDPSSIITSWWDYNHMFKAIADRRVTFDGGSQNTPQAYWVGKLFLSDDERVSIGIARMLNCGGNKAFDEVDKHLTNIPDSVALVNEIITVDRWHAENLLVERLSMSYDETESVLQYTHCEPPESYIIASGDMVGKSGVWGHFGSWDFTKATMYQNTHNLARADAVAYLTTTFNLSEEEADRMYSEIQTTKGDQWIAPWPGYLSSGDCDTLSYTEIRCAGSAQGGNFAFRIDLNTFNVTLENNPGIVPTSIVYPTEEGIQETELTGKKTGFSVVLLPDGEKHHFLLTDPSQAASTFTKLFFYEGHGMKCFSKFDDRRQITGDRIVTWKVDYSCSQVNDVYFTEPVEEKNISEDENNGITTTNETNHTSTEA